MKTRLSDDQVSRYRDDGFLKIEGFLNTDELSNWRSIIDNAVNTRNERIPGFNDGGKLGDDYYDKVFRQRVNIWRTDGAVKDLVLNEKIGRMAAALEGLSAVRLWHDQALYKGPWANPTSWHIDDPYWSFFSRDEVMAYFA